MKQYDGYVTVIRGEHVYNDVRIRLVGDAIRWEGVLGRFAHGSPAFMAGDEVVLRFDEGGEVKAKVTHAEHDTQEIRPQGFIFPTDIILTPRRVLVKGQGLALFK